MFGREKTVLEVVHIAEDEARVVPWRNGGGVTRELASWPPDAGLDELDFEWRISSAPVKQAGAFSSFPGVERILVVTSGAGLVLAHGEEAPRTRLRRLEPYRFSGTWATRAELPAGPVINLNVMLRMGELEAEVQVLTLGLRRTREALAAGHGFVHLLTGSCSVRVTGEEDAFELERGDSLWLRGLAGGEELDLCGEEAPCEMVLVRIGPRA